MREVTYCAGTSHTKLENLENLLYPRRSRLMPPTDLQIYFRPRVTLTFDFVTHKVDRFMFTV